MSSGRNFEKISLWIVKIGLWVIPFLPLYVSSSMLFPFITGKNFMFRILVGIIFVFWMSLALSRPEYRPKLTPLFKAATIFIVILFLADLFSPNPYRSFFSNYERMEGFMMHLHLYLYLVMLISVFKERRDWLIFFHTTLFTSIIVGLIGLLQWFGFRVSLQGGFRVDSTIGNPTYLAAYLSFHAWMLLLLLQRFWHKWGLRIFYGVAFFFELFIIYLTATRGATLGMLLGFIVLLAFSLIFWKKIFPTVSSFRPWAGAIFFLLLLLPLFLWSVRDTQFVKSNKVLSRTTTISLADRTTQARFSIWKMSARAVLERPILGWGQENYYLVFQKYFDPKLYSSEPWFDRSHNIFLDWLIHAGVAGLLGFFSMLGVALFGIFRGMRSGAVLLWEGAVLLTMFLAYFLQNIFVFDNLNTYLLFYGFLGYSVFLISSPTPATPNRMAPRSVPWVWGFTAAGIVIFLFAGYFLHWKPMRESNTLLKALVLYQQRAPLPNIQSVFEKALSYHAFGDTEVREQLANVSRDVINNSQYPIDERTRFVKFAIDELKKELNRPAKDVKHMIFLASVLTRAGAINAQYLLEAEQIIKEAIALSPTKQILYLELAQLYLTQNRVNEALEVLRTTVKLEPSYDSATVNLFAVAQLARREDIIAQVRPIVLASIKTIGLELLDRAGNIFRERREYAAAKDVYIELSSREPDNPKFLALASALLAELGETDRAIIYAEAAARLDPEFAKEAEVFIRQLKNRR